MTDENSVSIAYRPQPGDPETTEAYGRHFKAGEFVDVPDEFAGRARNNPSFEVKGEKSFGDKNDKDADNPRFDDPYYLKDANSAPDLSFEEAVALETAKEYGTDDPELAERLRVARQHNRDTATVSRIEAEAIVKRRPGRPKKTDNPPVDEEAKARAEAQERDQAAIDAENRRQAEEEAERRRLADAEQARRDNERAAQQATRPV